MTTIYFRKVIVFLCFTASLFLSGCLSNQSFVKDSNETINYAGKSFSADYQYLFDKNVPTGHGTACLKAFQHDGFLYMYESPPKKNKGKPTSVGKITVYDARTGLFALVIVYQRSAMDCDIIDFRKIKPQHATFYYIASPEFKILLDNAAQNPDELKSAINASSSYFRSNGEYKGETTSHNLKTIRLTRIHSLNEVSRYLNNISLEEANRLSNSRTKEISAIKSELKAREDQYKKNKKNAQHDSAGREIINGPVMSGIYTNVHIISNTVGVDAQSATMITNSVIEAAVCVRSSGMGLTLQNNDLRCGLCVEFVGNVLINNSLVSNNCTGRGTNRPDVFNW